MRRHENKQKWQWVTSADVERLFSTAGDIFTNEQNRLLPENGEKKLFCRENFPLLKLQYD